jgi:hypothetical protein
MLLVIVEKIEEQQITQDGSVEIEVPNKVN